MVWVLDFEGGPGRSWRERVDMASEQFSVEAMVRGYHERALLGDLSASDLR